MRKGSKLLDTACNQRGFALLIVLWTLVLIAFLVAHLTATGRTEVRIAGNLAANAAAQAAADGAIYQAIFYLSDPRPDHRWALDGAAHVIQIGRSNVTVELKDEAALVNPNLASPELVAALLQVLGSDRGQAAAVAVAIAEWVGAVSPPRPPAAVLADYQAAGLNYGPPGSPLESLDELLWVRGMTPAIFAALRPHLTLFGPPQPDPANVDPVVGAALIGQIGAGAAPIMTGVAPPIIARIHAAARGPGNALVTRTAVARVGPELPNGYTLLAWGDDEE
jgi:general secretion pathway protein K